MSDSVANPMATVIVPALLFALLAPTAAFAAAPKAKNDEATTTINQAVVIDVLANDEDKDGDRLTVAFVSSPRNGRVTNNGVSITYTPNLNFTGKDRFTYWVTDGRRGFDSANVDIEVIEGNRAPQARNDQASVDEDRSVDIAVLDNDEDPDGDQLGIQSFTQPEHGQVTLVGRSLRYTPEPDFAGTDRFTYTATDGERESSADVTVTVRQVDDPPRAVDDRVTVDEDESIDIDVLANDIDPDGDRLRIVSFTSATHGRVEEARGGLRYTPDPDYAGGDSFRYTVSDGGRESSASVEVTVRAVNDVPVITGQQALETREEEALEIQLQDLIVVDPDNDYPADFALSVRDGPGYTRSGNTVTPLIGSAGTMRVPVTVSDGRDSSSPFELVVTVLPRARTDIASRLAATPAPAMVDDTVTWTLAVENAGPDPARAVVLRAELTGTGITAEPLSDPRCEMQTLADGLELECTLGDVAVGRTETVNLATRVRQAGDLRLVGMAVEQADDRDDRNPENNTASLSVNVTEGLAPGPVQELTGLACSTVAVGDLAGDGAVELVIGARAGIPNQVLFQESPRAFGMPGAEFGGESDARALALGDLDGDGDLDVAIANAAGGNPIFLNQGDALNRSAILGAAASRDVAIADFNGDGFADLVFADAGGGEVYANDGNGGFAFVQRLAAADNHGVAAADFDCDGRTDVAMANLSSEAQVYINTTTAAAPEFASPVTLPVTDAVDVTAADFDGDCRFDLAFAVAPTSVAVDPANPVFMSDSARGFVLSAALGATPTLVALSGDVNGDGAIDLLFLNTTGTHPLELGDGAGGFTLSPEQIYSPGAVDGALARLDGNAALDLVLCLGDEGGDVYLNDGRGKLGLGDAEPPVLTLKGEERMVVVVGQSYDDPGATAMDNVDGDLSDRIVVQGSVNTNLVGEFTTQYQVTDSSGNTAYATRVVVVEPRPATSGGGGGAWSLELFLLLLGLAHARRLRRLAFHHPR